MISAAIRGNVLGCGNYRKSLSFDLVPPTPLRHLRTRLTDTPVQKSPFRNRYVEFLGQNGFFAEFEKHDRTHLFVSFIEKREREREMSKGGLTLCTSHDLPPHLNSLNFLANLLKYDYIFIYQKICRISKSILYYQDASSSSNTIKRLSLFLLYREQTKFTVYHSYFSSSYTTPLLLFSLSLSSIS